MSKISTSYHSVWPPNGRLSPGGGGCSAFYAPDTLGHFLCLFDNITFWGEAVDSSSKECARKT